MRQYNPEKALLSLHVFKTGGTSFMSCLKEWFGEGYYQHYLHHDTGRKPYLIPWDDPNWAFVHNPQSLPICIHGHFDKKAKISTEDYYPGHRQIVTFFRNPVDAHLSAYYFQKGVFEKGELYYHGERLEEFPFRDVEYFFEKFPSFLLDDFPWELTKDNFKNVLSDRFIHIGLTEKMQISTDIIAERLGKPQINILRKNATERSNKDRPSEGAVEEFIKRNSLEFAIYDWVKELNLTN